MAPRKPIGTIVRPDLSTSKRPAPVPVARPAKKAALSNNTSSKPVAKIIDTLPSKTVVESDDDDDEIENGDDDMDMDMEDFDMEDFEGFEDMEEDEDDDDDEKYDVDELLDLDASAKMNKMQRRADGTYKNDDDEASDESDVENVDVAIDFFDVKPERDYHAVRGFLKNYIDDSELNIDDFSDIITNQVEVGTVVKADDAGAEPLGFITALDLHEHREKEPIKQVLDFILNNMGNPTNRATFEKIIKDANTKPLGLLIQDRVKNLPMEIVPVLYNEFGKDLDWAAKESKNKKFNFENFIIIAKSCEVGGTMNQSSNNDKKKKKKKEDASAVQDVWYTQFEDEFFQEHATFIRKFPGNTLVSWPGVGRLPSSFAVMVVPRSGYNAVVKMLNAKTSVNGESLC